MIGKKYKSKTKETWQNNKVARTLQQTTNRQITDGELLTWAGGWVVGRRMQKSSLLTDVATDDVEVTV
jgi:hypothetical protein